MSSSVRDADAASVADHATSLVGRFAELTAADARRFVAEARTLVDLDACADLLDPVFGSAVWAAEAGFASGLSEGSVRARTARAHRLLALPALCEALEAGTLAVPHALAVMEVLLPARADVAARVVRTVVAEMHARDDDRPAPAVLAERVRRAWYAHDADAVAATRTDALDRRAVWVRHLGEPGVSAMGTTGSAELVQAAKHRLSAAAGRPVDAADLRTAAQREADLLLELLTHGSLPGTPLPAAALQLALHCPVETVQGRSDEPGLLVGVGLLDADHCRELALAADLVTVGVDPGSRMPLLRDESPAGTSRCTGPRSGELLRAEAARLQTRTLRPEQPGVVGVASVEVGYRPGARLERFVHTRFPSGVSPSGPAWRLDTEHPVAWPAGPTSGAHLTTLGRRWHRLKQAGFCYDVSSDGTVVWTSPGGRRVAVLPVWRAPAARRRTRGSAGTADPDP